MQPRRPPPLRDNQMLRILIFLLCCLLGGVAHAAAPCGGDFAPWRAALADEARASGISDAVIALLDDIEPNPEVLAGTSLWCTRSPRPTSPPAWPALPR